MTEQETELKLFRQLLWLRHGCSISSLYGDDGEMQCSHCMIDFKRNSAEEINGRFLSIGQTKFSLEVKMGTK